MMSGVLIGGATATEGGINLDPNSLIIWLIIGAIAGWLAGQIVKGGGFGLIGDIIVGIVGAFIAGELFPFLGLRLGGGMLFQIITAAIGACILLFIVRLVRRAFDGIIFCWREGLRPVALTSTAIAMMV